MQALFKKPLWAIGLGFIVLYSPFVSFAEVNGNRAQLNATFKDMTLEDALSEIVDTTGINIVTSQKLDQKVLVTFQAISAEKLLKRLLHGYNAMYLKNPATGQLESVRIFASRNAPPPIANTPLPTDQADNEAVENNGQYYMTVHINGSPTRMLVDTGANTLAISQNVAMRVGLPIGRATPVNTAAGQASGYLTTVDSVVIAGKELKNIKALILPNLKENGLIGQNILTHFRRVTENGKMRLDPLEQSNQPQDDQNKNDAPQNAPKQPINNSKDQGQPNTQQKVVPQPKAAPKN